MIEKTLVIDIVFHSTGRILRMISDPVTVNMFLEPIFQAYCHFYQFSFFLVEKSWSS